MNEPWDRAKSIMGAARLTLGRQMSAQYRQKPEHLMMVLARYWAASHLIGNARTVIEVGCGEGIGAGILARGRFSYLGIDQDAEAIKVADRIYEDWGNIDFEIQDVTIPALYGVRDAAVLLDVIEHIPQEQEQSLMRQLRVWLKDHGICVVGTPNQQAEAYASEESRAGHINLYSYARLHALLEQHFHRVQAFGMQDTGLHAGHPEMRHYLMMVGIGPR